MLNPVAILKRAYDAILDEPATLYTMDAACMLTSAIRHITRPERDIYPKTRRGTKTRPVTRTARKAGRQ